MRRMPQRFALQRVEFGAGVATAVIGVLTLPMALLAPLYPVCPTTQSCAQPSRYTSLLAARPDVTVWALLLALLALTLAGAAGAIADARATLAPGARLAQGVGLLALWGAALLVFTICALGSRGPLGLLYLPSTVALALAAYVALLRRLAARRATTAADDTPNAG